MQKGLRMMILWLLVVPITVTLLHVFKEFIAGNNIELLSCSAIFLGFAAGGLVFGVPLNYLIFKLFKVK